MERVSISLASAMFSHNFNHIINTPNYIKHQTTYVNEANKRYIDGYFYFHSLLTRQTNIVLYLYDIDGTFSE